VKGEGKGIEWGGREQEGKTERWGQRIIAEGKSENTGS
jgi:hypothetical protein